MLTAFDQKTIDKIMNSYTEELKVALGENLKAVILYGSCARGENGLDSDMDVFVMVEENDKKTEELINEISFNHQVSKVVYSVESYIKYYWETLLQNIRKEGKIYYGNIWSGNIIMHWNDKVMLSKVRLENAHDSMKAAKKIMDIKEYYAAIGRIYYAAYFCIRALMILEHSERSKHYGNISEFKRLYIHTGIFKKAFSDYIEALFKARNVVDYKPEEFQATEENMQTLLGYAQEMVETIDAYLNKQYSR